MRITPAILLAALVGCSSSTGSPGPRDPASVEGAGAASPAGTSEDERVAAVLASFEKMVDAMGPADGDCRALAARVRAFAATEDADAIRRMTRDPELVALLEERRESIERDHAAMKERFMNTVTPCTGDGDFEQALDESGLFLKKRDESPVSEAARGAG